MTVVWLTGRLVTGAWLPGRLLTSAWLSGWLVTSAWMPVLLVTADDDLDGTGEASTLKSVDTGEASP